MFQADQFTRATASSKLSVIAEQVRFLQEQARKVLEEANLNKELHHIACNFKKIPGKVYYVYKKPGPQGSKYISMISPDVSWDDTQYELYSEKNAAEISLYFTLESSP